MKILLFLLLTLNVYTKDFDKNKIVYNKVEESIKEEIPNFINKIENLEGEVNLGLYIGNTYIKSKNKLINNIKNELLTLKNVSVISENYDEYSKILEKQNNSKYEDVRLVGQLKKTRYLLKIDYNNLEYTTNFYLKNYLSGIISLEVIDLASGSVIFGSYKEVEVEEKIEKEIIFSINALLIILAIITNKLTRKYYTLRIFSLYLIFIFIINVYYFLVI